MKTSFANASFLPDSALLPLVEFVLGELPPAVSEAVHVAVSSHGGREVRGWSYEPQRLPKGFKLPDERTHFVNLEIGRRIWVAPRSVSREKQVFPIALKSWEEEFILVLAHELAHVAQRLGLEGFGAKNKETEAELFGQTLVFRFRPHAELAATA